MPYFPQGRQVSAMLSRTSGNSFYPLFIQMRGNADSTYSVNRARRRWPRLLEALSPSRNLSILLLRRSR